MKERTLRDSVGIGIVVSHIFVVCLAYLIYLSGGMDSDEITNLMAAVIPVISVYTTAVVSYYIDNRYRGREGKAVNKVYAFIAILFPLIYFLSVCGLMITFSYTQRLSFDELIKSLVLVESAFAVYATKIVQSMFSFELPTNE